MQLAIYYDRLKANLPAEESLIQLFNQDLTNYCQDFSISWCITSNHAAELLY